MDAQTFARHLSAWIQPGVIARAASEYRDTPEAALADVKFILTSPTTKTAAEAGLAKLLHTYLDNFALPNDVIQVARLFYGSHMDDPEVVRLLEGLQFSGKVDVADDVATRVDDRFSFRPDQVPIAIIACRCIEFRLISHPVEMLNDLVSSIARTIQVLHQTGRRLDSFHQELTHDTALANFVEAHVGLAYGAERFGKAGMTGDIHRISSTLRQCTVYGPNIPTEDMLRDLSISGEFMKRPTSESF